MSSLPPSAATVRARNILSCTSSGNVSNSFRAPFSHEIGRVFRILGYLTKLSTNVKFLVALDRRGTLLRLTLATFAWNLPGEQAAFLLHRER
jgi:hypothetical protein